MKKFLAVVAVLAILMSLAVPAFASPSSEAGNGGANGGNGAGDNNGTTSPQTGFDTTVWVVTAAGLLLCAGFCFAGAKKVSE